MTMWGNRGLAGVAASAALVVAFAGAAEAETMVRYAHPVFRHGHKVLYHGAWRGHARAHPSRRSAASDDDDAGDSQGGARLFA